MASAVKVEESKPDRDPGLKEQKLTLPRIMDAKVVVTLTLSELDKNGNWTKKAVGTSGEDEFGQVDVAFLRAIRMGHLLPEKRRIDEVLVTITSKVAEGIIKENTTEDEVEPGRGSLANFFGQRRQTAEFSLEIGYTEMVDNGWSKMTEGRQEHQEFDLACLSAQRMYHRLRVHNQWIFFMRVRRNEMREEDNLFAGFAFDN